MPTITYKARLYDRHHAIEIPIFLSTEEYNALFQSQSPGSGISQERRTILTKCVEQASDKLNAKEKLHCFSCDKPAQCCVGRPGIDTDRHIIHDIMHIPVCGDPICTAEGQRVTSHILEEYAKAQNPSDKRKFRKNQNIYCAFCERVEDKGGPKMQVCSRCKCMYYCSRDCQAKHWKSGHKKTCKPHDVNATYFRNNFEE